jgi:uncharacterized protein (DUF4415 family)
MGRGGAREGAGRPPLGEKPRETISIRVDRDVMDWAREETVHERGALSGFLNRILRAAMERAKRRK